MISKAPRSRRGIAEARRSPRAHAAALALAARVAEVPLAVVAARAAVALAPRAGRSLLLGLKLARRAPQALG
jgi:hypothetical protein